MQKVSEELEFLTDIHRQREGEGGSGSVQNKS